MAVDHCFGPVGLHRLEIAIRPENAASLRVVAKLGLREEGLRERFLHIQGDWRDHRTFAVTARGGAGRAAGPMACARRRRHAAAAAIGG